jgi:hypothetical protein
MRQSDVVLSILDQNRGPVSLTAFIDANVSSMTLRRMLGAHLIEQPAVGFYTLPGQIDPDDLGWVEFALRVPKGVIGLQTAAFYHRMTEKRPAQLNTNDAHVFLAAVRRVTPRIRGIR